jgi:hypothetical protein
MDMAFDLDTAAQARAEGSLAGRHPIWAELAARMAAARQVSGSLGRELRAAARTGCGSFHQGTAEILVAQGERRVSVNPNDLGNRKSDGATSSSVAGETSTGGRGK